MGHKQARLIGRNERGLIGHIEGDSDSRRATNSNCSGEQSVDHAVAHDSVIQSICAEGKATKSCRSTPPKRSRWVMCIIGHEGRIAHSERELIGHNEGD